MLDTDAARRVCLAPALVYRPVGQEPDQPLTAGLGDVRSPCGLRWTAPQHAPFAVCTMDLMAFCLISETNSSRSLRPAAGRRTGSRRRRAGTPPRRPRPASTGEWQASLGAAHAPAGRSPRRVQQSLRQPLAIADDHSTRRVPHHLAMINHPDSTSHRLSCTSS